MLAASAPAESAPWLITTSGPEAHRANGPPFHQSRLFPITTGADYFLALNLRPSPGARTSTTSAWITTLKCVR